MNDLDINKVLVGVLNKQIDDMLSRAKNAVAGAQERLKARFRVGFSSYVLRTFQKCAYIKTILYRDKPVSLKAHYVEPKLKCQEELIDGARLTAFLEKSRRIAVVGIAGLGKSLLMKSLFLDLVNEGYKKIPIFVELRDLNTAEAPSLKFHILSRINGLLPEFTEEIFEYSLLSGAFVILLDGFDEIDYDSILRYEKEILAFTMKYGSNDIVVSSRPDDRFAAWQEFSVLHLMPMDKDKTVQLVTKIDYDPVVKAKFIARLVSDLFDQHEEFLSNPLLATMMLLTFEQIADIPAKTHIFYQQAFETLFHKHDATKEVYARKRFTSLPIDQFRNILGAFALITYLAEKFSFTPTEGEEFLIEALELDGTQGGRELSERFLHDLLTSVCILLRDGNECRFSHRSFQEFFAADFLSRSDKKFASRMIQKLAVRVVFDELLEMLKDMNAELVERHWALPRLRSALKKIDGAGHYVSARAFYGLFGGVVRVEKKYPHLFLRGQAYFDIVYISQLFGLRVAEGRDRPYWDSVAEIFEREFGPLAERLVQLEECSDVFLEDLFQCDDGPRLLLLGGLFLS